MDENRKLFSASQAAKQIGVTSSWLRQLELRGELPPARRAATYRVYDQNEIEELRQAIAARRSQQRQTATAG